MNLVISLDCILKYKNIKIVNNLAFTIVENEISF